MINNILKDFIIGSGGIGDFLLTISTKYFEEAENVNLVFFANNPTQIKEIVKLFPKIKKSLILNNDYYSLKEFYNSEKCKNTGILPKDLNYQTWTNVNIFSEYGIIENPSWLKLFTPKRIYDSQIFLQKEGSNVEGNGKIRKISDSNLKKIYDEFELFNFITLETLKNNSYKEIFEIILGSDIVISCDSFSKTLSSLANIKTIVFDNIYNERYLNNFRDGIDAGHHIFIYPFKCIELRKQ
jgi:hypothetical protein